MLRQLPNVLTALRLLLLPLFVGAVLDGRAWLSIGLLVASGVSDVLDGYVARRLDVASPLGRILDSGADKLTQICGLVLLTVTDEPAFSPLPPFVLGIVLARDLVLVYGVLSLYRRLGRPQIRARWEGKATTAVVFGLLVASILGCPGVHLLVLSIATIPLIVASTVRYILDGRRQLQAERSG